MSNWFHRFWNPHCPDCIDENKDSKVCPSCENLKAQLEMVNHHNIKLLDRLIKEPEPEPFREPVSVTKPRYIPWNVKKQMLEAEDRERARLMREAPKPTPIEDLEKELDIA